jgi:hypothetical protein
MVSHARYTHMVESIDITNTELEEVSTVVLFFFTEHLSKPQYLD